LAKERLRLVKGSTMREMEIRSAQWHGDRQDEFLGRALEMATRVDRGQVERTTRFVKLLPSRPSSPEGSLPSRPRQATLSHWAQTIQSAPRHRLSMQIIQIRLLAFRLQGTHCKSRIPIPSTYNVCVRACVRACARSLLCSPDRALVLEAVLPILMRSRAARQHAYSS
jgi:hypothetical protein